MERVKQVRSITIVVALAMSRKPTNGPNLSERRSNLKSKNNKRKLQLVQGDVEKERKEQQLLAIDRDNAVKIALKKRFKDESRLLNIELGFTDATVEEISYTPEWKAQKLFIKRLFPNSVMCVKFNEQYVFKNKQSMQRYHCRVATQQEWDNNMKLLMKLRAAIEANDLKDGLA